MQGRIDEGKLTFDVTELRIHEYTERGDNDTVKGPHGLPVKVAGTPCKKL
jgi:hypothetical protein